MIEAAAQSFMAARNRYREKKRLSRSTSGKSLDRQSIASLDLSSDLPSRRICSKHSGRELQLDDNECEQLSNSFASLPNKYDHFEHIDLNIPIVFGMSGIPEAELRRKTPFRTHVCKFQRFLTTVMDLLPKHGREEELVQIIRMVGRQHCQVKQLSFTAARWLSFKTAMIETFATQRNGKLKTQWSLLIAFLIYEIKDAFLAHIRTLRSSSLPQIVETYRLEFRRKKSQTQSPQQQKQIEIKQKNK
uniref:GLOBIN domain-containing protein n=1 Tax=Meloidogyne hapla TaxID=6305 RepID=A0A1I8BMB5_MELHA